MGFNELTKSLVEDIKKLNTFAKDNKLENEIKIDSILDKIIKQEKEYALFEHKKKLNELKKKHNENDLPDVDGFTKTLFNIEPMVKNEKPKTSSNEPKNTEQKRFDGNVLHEQLNAAIIARRGAVNGND